MSKSFSLKYILLSFRFSLPLAARFRALFVLRNIKDNQSVSWIGKAFSDPSALLKHELAYCLGQMQNKSAIPVLSEVLEDVKQGRLCVCFQLHC